MAWILFLSSFLSIIWVPFTKVEESFNVQATHDLLYHGVNIEKYDHHEFPGVVPRTFIGPLVLSVLSSPLVIIIDYLQLNKIWSQYAIRSVLSAINISAMYLFLTTIKKIYGKKTYYWTLLITASQFHFIFYVSRPLPNIFALPLVLIAFSCWLNGSKRNFIIAAGASIIIFRSELMTLFGILLAVDIFQRKITLFRSMKIIITTALILIPTTILIDSVFWRTLLWPEAEVFWFNTVLNKSKDWGTLPFLWYFYSALPRSLSASYIFLPIGFLVEKRIRPILLASFVYILMYSFLPHKELRFILYTIPVFNATAAIACSKLWENRNKSLFTKVCAAVAALHLFGNLLFTILLTNISANNYPGGHAMYDLHKINLVQNTEPVEIHIGNLAAQTGVTRFLELNKNWKYNKYDYFQDGNYKNHTFKFLLIESEDFSKLNTDVNHYKILKETDCFKGLALMKSKLSLISIKTSPCILTIEKLE